LNKKPLVKIEFDFEITNEKEELITKGLARLVFMDMKKSKPIKGPSELLDQINSHFD
jgi:acyl-CoA thioester hydrolase